MKISIFPKNLHNLRDRRTKIRTQLATIGFLEQESFQIRLKTRERSNVAEVFRKRIPEISDRNKNSLTSNCDQPKTVVCFEGIDKLKRVVLACYTIIL